MRFISIEIFYSFLKSHFSLPFLILIILCFSLPSCNTTGPDSTQGLDLTVSDVSCTEAWLKIKVKNLNANTQVQLVRNKKLVNTFNITTRDTTLYDDSLSPNQTYSYQLTELQNGNAEAKSEMVTVKTMDTTSNNFTWETFTFGGNAGSCAFYDCAIVNDTLAYAVGEVYLVDSTGKPDPYPYNFAKWDGKKWSLKKISVDLNGNQIIAPLKGIFVLQDGKIILSSGVPYLPDGNGGWKLYQLWNMGILNQNDGSVFHIWGSLLYNIYFAGNNGTIVHYQYGSWLKIESNTSSIINDIWGITNRQGKLILYCPVSSFFVPGDKKILKITGSIVDSVEWNRDVRLYSAWTSNDNFLYVCGEGAYVNKFGKWEQINLPKVGTNSIRGNNINDIFIVGDYGFKAHFNGMHWQVISSFNDKGYSKVDFKGNIVVLCGNYNGKGLIEIGIRN